MEMVFLNSANRGIYAPSLLCMNPSTSTCKTPPLHLLPPAHLVPARPAGKVHILDFAVPDSRQHLAVRVVHTQAATVAVGVDIHTGSVEGPEHRDQTAVGDHAAVPEAEK